MKRTKQKGKKKMIHAMYFVFDYFSRSKIKGEFSMFLSRRNTCPFIYFLIFQLHIIFGGVER